MNGQLSVGDAGHGVAPWGFKCYRFQGEFSFLDVGRQLTVELKGRINCLRLDYRTYRKSLDDGKFAVTQ